MTVADAGIDTEGPRRSHLLRAGIDADDAPAARRQRRGQHAVAAAEVEDFVGLPRRQQLDERPGEVGNEAAMLGIAGGVPALLRRRARPTRRRFIWWRRRPHCRSG